MPRLPRLDLPLDARVVALLCATYLLVGLVGHSPWKADDAIHIDVAFGMATGDALLPSLAGEPWYDAPPLYFWLAAFLGQALGGFLGWHGAARLATFVFAAAALACLVKAARDSHGEEGASVAALLGIGTVGLIVPLHEAQPAVCAFLASAAALRAYALLPLDALRGGLWLGGAVVVGFLGSGIEVAAMLLAVAALLALRPHWRRPGSARGWLTAGAVMLSVGSLWPLAVAFSDPHWGLTWWRHEAAAALARRAPTPIHLELLLWGAWPVLPLAAWTLWASRGRLDQPARFAPLLLAAFGLAHFLSAPAHALNLLPALPPLILLAHGGLASLRRGAANALDWFGMMTFGLAGGLLWLGGISMLSGWPARVAKNFSRPAPGFVAEVSPWLITSALLATLAWLWIMLAVRRSPWRMATRWAVGIVALWVVLVSLLMQWIDYGKSYASTVAQLRAVLPPDRGCILGEKLGPAQRAVLDYHGRLRTVAKGSCGWLLVQAEARDPAARAGWMLVREAHRPGDKTERLRLYRRVD